MDSGTTEKSTDRSQLHEQLTVPDSLRAQLNAFRQRVWTTKIAEAILTAMVAFLFSFLTVYCLDRFIDTPQFFRFLFFVISIAIWAMLPRALYRWVWKNRTLDQLARLLRVREPAVGDQLLSVIELAENTAEQSRSRSLCAAAIKQVADSAKGRDFHEAAPPTRVRGLAFACAIAFVASALLMVLFPAAAQNAWARFASPWRGTPRFTFTQITPLSPSIVVPHGEPVEMTLDLEPSSLRQPSTAIVQINQLPPILVERAGDNYPFSLPPQTFDSTLSIRVGDYAQLVNLQPKMRPELVEAFATVELPSYLEQSQMLQFDVRGGVLNALEGSQAIVSASASRALASAKVNNKTVSVEDSQFTSNPVTVDPYVEPVVPIVNPEDFEISELNGLDDWLELEEENNSDLRETSDESELDSTDVATGDGAISIDTGVTTTEQNIVLEWTDFDQLSGAQPFVLRVNPLRDELPTVLAQDLERQSVVIVSEQINFQALAADDFGLKRIGISWKSFDSATQETTGQESTEHTPAPEGEKVIASGGPLQTSMQTPAVFSAKSLGIKPQPLDFRLWVEDYCPDHPRVYSPSYMIFVLSEEEHAIWISEQLAKWNRNALDVRDAELQLFAANQQLRESAQMQLDRGDPLDADLRQQLQRQSGLEASNARRLNLLTSNGTDLLRQAARNPEINAEKLDRWATTLNVLTDISQNRMPSVVELLQEASDRANNPASDATKTKPGTSQPGDGSTPPESSGPTAGENRNESANGEAGVGDKDDSEQPAREDPDANEPPNSKLPSIQDIESSMQNNEQSGGEQKKPSPPKPAGGKLTLPTTGLVGPPKKPEAEEEATENAADDSAVESLDEALFEQEQLLEEFEQVSDELNDLLSNLEGSTLVKRLKVAARGQLQIAEDLTGVLATTFGNLEPNEQEIAPFFDSLKESEDISSKEISFIMDDLQAFYERRRLPSQKEVLDEMKESSVIDELRDLGVKLKSSPGLSIAQVEYWADTLDRWAEDLVPPAKDGGKSSKDGKSEPADAMPPALILAMLKVLEGEVNLREATRVEEQAKAAVDAKTRRDSVLALNTRQGELQSEVTDLVVQLSEMPGGATRFGTELGLLTEVSIVMSEVIDLLAADETGSRTMAAETEIIELMLKSSRINPQTSAGGGSASSDPGGGSTGTTDQAALALLGGSFNQSERREYRDVSQSTGETGRELPQEYRGGLDLYFEKIESLKRAE